MAADSTAQPHILIYGSGAVGSLLGGRLAASGRRVTLLGRPAVPRAVAEHGLRVAYPGGQFVTTLPVVTTADALTEEPDIVLLAVKAYAVERSWPDIERLAGRAIIVALQNGIGTEERLLSRGGVARLVAGSLTLSVSLEGHASVRQETDAGGVALAPVRDPSAAAPVATALRAAGIAAPILSDYRAMKWSKLLLNMLANATAAIVALPPRAIYADPQLFRIEQAALREALHVIQAMAVTPVGLPGFNVPLLAHAMRLPAPLARRLVGPRAARGRGDKRPSLWLDIERGREQTEIAWLNGAIARVGAEHGVPTPVNARLAELVNDIACHPGRRAMFAQRPDRLVEAVYRA